MLAPNQARIATLSAVRACFLPPPLFAWGSIQACRIASAQDERRDMLRSHFKLRDARL
jgi:hypothetical protein